MTSSTRPAAARLSHLLRVTAWGVLFVVWSGAHAATLHVDNSCPTSGDGTTTSCGPNGPFRTISQAMGNSQLTAGSTIRVRATGISYVEGTMNTPRAGTASARITVTRYVTDTGKPVWGRSSGITMLIVDDAYWTFDNIVFSATTDSNDIVQVQAPNVAFTDCEFREGGQAINIGDLGDNLDVDRCTFDGNGNGTRHAITTGRLGVTSNYVLTGVRIANSTFTNGDQDYIQTFEGSGGCRLATFTGTIDRNTFTYGPGQVENAIDVKTTALPNDPLNITNNTITGWSGDSNNGRPVVVQHCSDYVHFNYNTVDAGSGTCNPCLCLIFSASTAFGQPPQTGLEVIGNTFLNCKYAMTLGEGGSPAGDISNIKILNNTAAKLRSDGDFINVRTNLLSGEVKNNLWDGTNTSGTTALDCTSGAWNITALDANYNGWFGSPTQRQSCSSDCTGDICGGNDTTGLDPMFINWTANNFRLGSGSPAIDKGTNIGLPFNGVAPDLGAYETTGGPPDTTPPAAPTGLVVTQ